MPVLECLEGRQLLTVFTGFSHVGRVLTPSGVFTIEISGPGILKAHPAGHGSTDIKALGTLRSSRIQPQASQGQGSVDIKVLGTTDQSTLTITQTRPRFHLPNGLMSINSLTIGSGQIGSIIANQSELDGPMTPLTTSLSDLELGAIGPNAQIDVNGNVGTMTLGNVALGPGGHVIVSGDLTGAASIGSMSIVGGQFAIGNDSLAPISIPGNMTLSQNGLFSIGRDETGTLAVGGSVIPSSGGQIRVGRNLAALTVGGDVQSNPVASGIVVGGNLNQMLVTGIFHGQGSTTVSDLGVGLDLGNLTVLGGAAGAGGIQFAFINVQKSINQLTVPHGIFQSIIRAGVSTNNMTVGADGTTALYNSEIDAGVSISNATFNGDVTSGFPTGDSSGFPTRIIAGKLTDGTYVAGGTINNLVINGSLINSVLAASVAPYGGNGGLPTPVAYGGTSTTSLPPQAGFSNYNAPGGLTDNAKNYSIRSVVGGVLDPTAVYDTANDPNIHVTVLPNGTTDVTVKGSVISTPHPNNDNFDFTGIFSANPNKGTANGGPAS